MRDSGTTKKLTPPEAEQEGNEMFTMPTIDNLVVLAALFDVTVDQILVVDTDVKVQISA